MPLDRALSSADPLGENQRSDRLSLKNAENRSRRVNFLLMFHRSKHRVTENLPYLP